MTCFCKLGNIESAAQKPQITELFRQVRKISSAFFLCFMSFRPYKPMPSVYLPLSDESAGVIGLRKTRNGNRERWIKI